MISGIGPKALDETDRRRNSSLYWVGPTPSPAPTTRHSPQISKSAILVRKHLYHGNPTHQIFHPSLLSAAFPFQVGPENFATSGVGRASLADSNHCWVHMGMQTRPESMGLSCFWDLHRLEKAVVRKCHPEHLHGHYHYHYPLASDLETAFTAFPEVASVRRFPNGRSVSDSPGAPTTCVTYISIPALRQPVSFAWLPLSVSNTRISRVYIATSNKALDPSQGKTRILTFLNR